MTQGIKYTIDGNKVEATLTNCKNDFKNLLRKWFNGKIPSWIDVDALEIPDTFVASAKCSDHDAFNENAGKELAKYRAIKKYNRALEVKLNWMIRTYANPLNAFQVLASNHIRRRMAINRSRGERISSTVHCKLKNR